MRPEHTQHLIDPLTGEALHLESAEEADGHVMTGSLTSSQNQYPITAGIPQLVPQENQERAFQNHQTKTADRFAFEWNEIYQENNYEKQNFLHFLHPFVNESDLQNKYLLDVGCGSGRFTKQAALAGAKLVIGTDLGDAVKLAFKLTKHFPNVCIVKADVYRPPVNKWADLTFSIGVLHHLPQPEQGFNSLLPTIQPNGQVLIWVYNRRKNFRAVYVFEALRKITRLIPPRILYQICYLPALGVHGLNQITLLFKELGLEKYGKNIPFSYYANFPFNMKHNDAFDVLATPKSNYYYVEDIENWFKRARLHSIQTYEHPEAGITAAGYLNQVHE